MHCLLAATKLFNSTKCSLWPDPVPDAGIHHPSNSPLAVVDTQETWSDQSQRDRQPQQPEDVYIPQGEHLKRGMHLRLFYEPCSVSVEDIDTVSMLDTDL